MELFGFLLNFRINQEKKLNISLALFVILIYGFPSPAPNAKPEAENWSHKENVVIKAKIIVNLFNFFNIIHFQ